MKWVSVFFLALAPAAAFSQEVRCPDGTRIVDNAPPEGQDRYCAYDNPDGTQTKHGPYVGYYLNGQVQKKGQYTNGSRTGAWTWWYPDGKKLQQGRFFDDAPAGTWVYWDENGHETNKPRRMLDEVMVERKPAAVKPKVTTKDFENSLQKGFK